MERLGESIEWGELQLRLLELAGWTIERRPTIGGGVLVFASKAGATVSAAGDTLAEASSALFQRALACRQAA
jgi:hypothetical protein